MRAKLLLTVTGALLLVGAASAVAQAPPAAPGTPAPPSVPVPDPKLQFDREVFAYPGDGRKDPFSPLSGTDAIGPLFEDLVLRGIAYSNEPKRSVALLNDGSKKLYRVHIGDVVGNARVASIEKNQVRMLVQSYGMIRQEVMSMAPRETVAEIREREQRTKADNLGQLFQQELLRVLQGQDTSRRPQTQAAPRRDTIPAAARPRN